MALQALMDFHAQRPQREVKEPQGDRSPQGAMPPSFPLTALPQGPSSRRLCFSLTRIRPEQMDSSDIMESSPAGSCNVDPWS